MNFLENEKLKRSIAFVISITLKINKIHDQNHNKNQKQNYN